MYRKMKELIEKISKIGSLSGELSISAFDADFGEFYAIDMDTMIVRHKHHQDMECGCCSELVFETPHFDELSEYSQFSILRALLNHVL